MIKTGLQNLFSVPIFTHFLNEKIVNDVEQFITPKLSDLEQTKDFGTDYYSNAILSPTDIPYFWEEINKITESYSNLSSIIKTNELSFWIQDYYPQGTFSRHSHGDAVISGIYYIRANKNAGSLRLIDPNPYTTITNYNIPNHHICYHEIIPQRGMVVLFPGWMPHEVLPSKNKDVVRTCLAFNYIK